LHNKPDLNNDFHNLLLQRSYSNLKYVFSLLNIANFYNEKDDDIIYRCKNSSEIQNFANDEKSQIGPFVRTFQTFKRERNVFFASFRRIFA